MLALEDKDWPSTRRALPPRFPELSEAENATVQEAFSAINAAFPVDQFGDWQDSVGDLISRNGNTFGFSQAWVPPNQKKGEDLPVQNTEAQLTYKRNVSRLVCAASEYAVAAIENRINYIIKTGLTYRCSKAHDRADEKLVAAVQQAIEFFDAATDLASLEQETLVRMDIDGEAFLRLFRHDDGRFYVRFVEPEHVRSPHGMTRTSSYGVETDPHDEENVLGYWIVENPDTNQPVFVPARDVLHLKGGRVFRSSKRGRPLFNCVFSNLQRVEQISSAVASIARARAKIALIRRLKAGTATTADKLREKVTAVKTTDPITGQERNIEQMKDGTILTTGDNVEYDYPAANLGAADFLEVCKFLLRGVAASVNMPEWMLTSNATDMGAYTASLVAEAPSTRSFERMQKTFVTFFAEGRLAPRLSLLWHVIHHFVDCGILPPEALTDVTITAEAASLVVRDKANDASVNKTYNDMGVKSVETIQAELGLNPEEEAMRLANEQPQQQPPALDDSVAEALLLDGWVVETGEQVQEAVGGVPTKITVTTKNGTTYTKTVLKKKEEAPKKESNAKKKEEPKKSDQGAKNEAPKTKKQEAAEKAKAKAAEKAKAKEVVSKTLGNPKKASAKQIGELLTHLSHLSLSELAEIKKQVGAKGGKTKADIAARIQVKVAEAKKAKKAKPATTPASSAQKAAPAPESKPADTKAIADTTKKFVADQVAKHGVGGTIGDLHTRLKEQHPNLTDGEYHDTLRAMHDAGQISLGGWAKTLHEMPDDKALFVGRKVMGYIQPGRNPDAELPPLPPRHPQAKVDSAVSDYVARNQRASFDQLHEHLSEQFPGLSAGQFQDTLRALRDAGKIELLPWQGGLHDLPDTDGLALFQGKKPMYYVNKRDA